MEPQPESPKIACALRLARDYPEDLMHLEHVARLSARLFEEFRPLHGLGPGELEMLYCAALLHDIGLSVSLSGHHKHSMRLIIESDLPALTRVERLMVANTARYHRKAQPSKKHRFFRELGKEEQQAVHRLAALLRIADGLDRAHENAVTQLKATAAHAALWILEINGPGDLAYAAWGARRKTDLFEETYGVGIRIEPKVLPS